MCKFCDDEFQIETDLDNEKLSIYLDSDNKMFLKIRVSNPAGNIIKPIKIKYCPFCGEYLKDKNCYRCYNYNIGDGIDDIRNCVVCKYNN